jgi:hypothetical protein
MTHFTSYSVSQLSDCADQNSVPTQTYISILVSVTQHVYEHDTHDDIRSVTCMYIGGGGGGGLLAPAPQPSLIYCASPFWLIL